MQRAVTFLSPAFSLIRTELRRNIGACSVLYAATANDPVQKLFVDKLREYVQKSKSSSSGLVDATPEMEKQLQAELEKLRVQYGGDKNADMNKFPTFQFKDPELDPFTDAKA